MDDLNLIKISDLPPTGHVSAGDIVPVVQSGVTKQVPSSAIRKYVTDGLGSAAFAATSDFEPSGSVLEVDLKSQARADAQNERIDRIEVAAYLLRNNKVFKAYRNKNLMLADVANIPAQSILTVVSDPNNNPDINDINGQYHWDGKDFFKLPNDIETLILQKTNQAVISANNYTDTVVDDIEQRVDVSKLLKLRSLTWLAAEALETNGYVNNAWFNLSQHRIATANAIKHIEIINADPTKDYYISVFCLSDPKYKDNVAISDGISNVLISGVIEIEKSDIGLTKVTLKSSVIGPAALIANLYIDYRELEGLTGILVNLVKSPLKISKTVCLTSSVEKTVIENTPAWMPTQRQPAFQHGNAQWKMIAKAIKEISLNGVNSEKEYFISVCTRNDSYYFSRIFISDGIATIAKYQKNVTDKKGVEILDLEPVNNSGISGSLVINWSEIPNGYVSPSDSTLYINCKLSNSYDLNKRLKKIESNQLIGKIIPYSKQLRVAVAGSSITWGSGYLSEQSYVGILENHLREQLATTIHAADLVPAAVTLTANNWYKGAAKRISGLNQVIELMLNGNELSLSIGRERGNAGACVVDVYVDDVKYSQFSTFNDEPLLLRSKSFSGNGIQLKFDLGECFTFDHVVSVDGVIKKGSLNTQGSGASIPAADDFMIVRNYNAALNKVTHVLWFKTAPAGQLKVDYKQGESISYMKSTIGNAGQSFSTALESSFGDGSIAESTTEPAAISSGLGFRETDDRSIVSFHFDEIKTRKFKLVISALDSRATGLTPFLDINFVTNRMHRIMNAGIGGWSANLFLTTDILLNRIDEVANFAPDIMLFESCTNDDWKTHLAKATVTRTGLTNAQVMSAETSLLYKNISGSANAKTVEDERIYITAATRNTITLESSVNDTNIAVSDVVIIGSYGGNHKRVVVRRVKSYDPSSKTIALDRAISADDFYQCEKLDDLVEDYLLIQNAHDWVSQVKQCVDVVTSANHLCKVFLATAGIPNYNHRRLFGYRELAQKFSAENDCGFVDFYQATFDFQYSQVQDVTVKTVTSTGSSEYSLGISSPRMLYNPIVLVDGIEHKQCRILGGYCYGWDINQSNPTLQNATLTNRNFKIVFDKNIPNSGANIVVKCASKTWSTDYTHPINIMSPGQSGRNIFGNTASLILGLNL